VVVGAAGAFSALVLMISFPFSTLLSQHRQLSAAATQLAAVRHQNQQLLVQEHQLGSKTEIERRARQDYQLVQPGQTLFALLPSPSGTGHSGTGSSGSAAGSAGTGSSGAGTGDPANQPLVPPSQASDLAPDPGLPYTPPASSSGAGAHPGGVRHGSGGGPTQGTGQAPTPSSSFWSRVEHSLEFWN
jgi:hypothetical protein